MLSKIYFLYCFLLHLFHLLMFWYLSFSYSLSPSRGYKQSFIFNFVLPYLLFFYSPMSLNQFFMLLLAGLSAAGGQFSITAAYCHAPAREISVYDYSQIIFSALLGFCFFGQIPDKYSILGYIIICSMAVFMFLYNNCYSSKE